MGGTTLLSVQTDTLWQKWHISMLAKDLEKARTIHNEIKLSLDDNDDRANSLYKLLYSRYLLMNKNFQEAHAALHQLESVFTRSQDITGYYFHFFNGLLATSQNEFDLADTHFREAFPLLKYVKKEEEMADYYYKASILYYHTRQPLTSFECATEAIKISEEHPGIEVITADCENILGLACTSLKQYEKAEEHFLNALDLANKNNIHRLSFLIRYNIGYLYAEQNMSTLAIKHLTEVYEAEEPHYKTIFLLAREYFKENDSVKGNSLIEEGFQVANEEYKHHFKILRCLQSCSVDSLQDAVEEGITYFEKQELWGFVEDYSEALAKHFHEKGEFETSSLYFNIAYEARVKLQRKEALK
jgi:tetratricopeptide (TPR) repeat protein